MGVIAAFRAMNSWVGTRRAGLERLTAFLPRIGNYAALRNYAVGEESEVSFLSPWIARRLVTEEEVWRAVRAQWSWQASEKFLQEVAWRTYWTGWLEMRPLIWRRWLDGVAEWRGRLAGDSGLRRRYEAACEGATGIACFDHWSRELRQSGWLHNHERMWFASIWIFTLELPWELGADFFYRHLLDASPASNTLSWRWVGGLQTPGKHYLARAENIRKYTRGRFDPRGQLREEAAPLPMDAPLPEPERERLPAPPLELPALGAGGGRTGLLIHGADGCSERFLDGQSHGSRGGHLREIVALGVADPGEACPEGSACAAARMLARQAREDAARRGSAVLGLPAEILGPAPETSCWRDTALAWARRHRLEEIGTPWAPVGWWQTELLALRDALAAEGCRMRFWVSAWDASLWPLATRGFFQFKKHLPDAGDRAAGCFSESVC